MFKRKEIAFWLLYISALLVFVLRPFQYERPVLYFILMAVVVAIIGVQVVSTLHDKRNTAFMLFKIILVGLTTQWTQLLVFPESMIATDPWYHQMVISKIMRGEAVSAVDYYGTLAFHFIVGGTSSLFGITQKWAMMLFVGIPYMAGMAIIIYNLGKLVHTYKVGLMSALALSMASMFIYYGIELIPSSLAIMLMMVAIYLIIQGSRKKQGSYIKYGIAFILLVSITFISSLVVIFSIGLLGLLWIGMLIYSKAIQKTAIAYNSFLIIGIAYGVMVLTWWIFGTGQAGTIVRFIGNEGLAVFMAQFMPSADALIEKGLVTGTNYFSGEIPDSLYWAESFVLSTNTKVLGMVNEYQSNVPLFEVILKRCAFLIYGLFGLYGAWKSKLMVRDRPFAFALLFCVVVVVVSNFANFFLSRWFFLSRHAMLSQILLAPFVGIGLVHVIDLVKGKLKYIALAVCLFGLSLSAYISPYANIDNQTFLPNSVPMLAFTDEDLQSIDEICTTTESDLYCDWYMGYYIYHARHNHPSWKIKKVYDFSKQLVLGDFSDVPSGSVVVVRDDIMLFPSLIGDRFYKIPSFIEYDNKMVVNPDGLLIWQNYKKIYDSRFARGYVR